MERGRNPSSRATVATLASNCYAARQTEVRVTTAYLRQYRFGSLCYRPQNDSGKFSLSHPPTRGVSTVINALISGFGYHRAGQHIAGGQRPASHSLHPSHLMRYPVPVRLVPLSLSPLGFRPAASAVSVGRLRPTRRAWSAGTGPTNVYTALLFLPTAILILIIL